MIGALVGATILGNRVARGLIGWFPPRNDNYFFAASFAVIAGIFLYALIRSSWRPSPKFQALTAAILLLSPILITQTVPGFKQLTQYAIPGRPVIATEARPTGIPLLYLYRGYPGSVTRLTSYRTGWTPPALSPDGTKIAFQDAEGQLELMTLDPQGKPISTHPLANLPGTEESPAWSPDSQTILFDVSTGYGSNLWVVHSDGTGLEQLTSDGKVWTGTFSTDGKQILYAHSTTSFLQDTDIWIMKKDGSDRREIGGTPGEDFVPIQSPDEDKVLFTSDVTGSEDVYTMNMDGSDLKDLTPDTPSLDEDWSWADGGRYILFLSNRSGSGGTFLYFMKPDGSEVRLALII